MSEVRPTYDDEIDLFEILETLWGGKWFIVTFVILVTFVGFVYSQVAQPKYEVSVPYAFNVYSVSTQQICDESNQVVECIESEQSKRLISLLEGGWNDSKKSSSLSLITINPLDVDGYKADFVRINELLTKEVYAEASTELALIQNELTDALLSTERVADNMLNAKRIIRSIDNGQMVLSFGSISVSQTSPKVPLILAMSIVLGGMISALFVLVRKAMLKRKERSA
ncbi:hypothetical protein UF64_09355 [Thalassospira sp. HJ]|uniref:Wzz/FepE/Etk N-terminal domain-containing protein n=1 Tax=Thalassospira sp. HJ TaxID=1616823 RepID=UPI0005CF8C65|nr:Wzz/FepE/Etk N-terminal domain-containing protein [Thalassospira sp. HJ]KJE34917.1 hypothetical protein UF64_09355 [Thalassospira sp. HJ]